jgi:hypothetical protein
MWHKSVRAAAASASILLAACGARTPDLPETDGGASDSGPTSGSGGKAGSAGSAGSGGSTGGTGGGGASGGTAGSGGASGGTGGSGGAGGGGGASGGAGAGGATGGAAGKGGSNPGDSGPGPYVTRAKGLKVNKIDLLFMIDNSSSMADKQEVLAAAIPQLVDRLIEPKCIDRITGRVVGQAVNGVCAIGVLDFEPVKDIHIGIVSSSLGNHGAFDVCDDAIDVQRGRSDPHNNDQGRLISRGVGGTNVPTFNSKGFLYYNPSLPGGLTSAAAVTAPFTDMVKGVGQHGCGYEASLEAVYRFLVDPDPFLTMRIDTSIGGFGQAQLNGTDTQLLQQRRDFLRPDSLVTVVLVTDENDCSIVDGGQGFYAILPPVTGTGRSVLQPGTSKCRENPNDKCCFNCGVQSPPAGCPSAMDDPECLRGGLLVAEDQPNIRCFNQKQRYGVDFMYPVQRYIDGFTQPLVPNRKGEMVQNPLFSDLTCTPGVPCASARDKNLVLVTGIVGVPWQDIAVDSVDLTKGYKTARQLRDDLVWSEIVGDPQNPTGPVAPRDLHMIESIKPRQGLPGPGSSWNADPKNGHEWDPSKELAQPNADLQYACIFNLVTPRMCAGPIEDCDCFGQSVTDVQSPLCQNPQGAYTNTQLRAKAYPGVRILQVLQGLGDQAVVGSICPAQTTDSARDDFGYAPVVGALIRRAREPLTEQCLPVALPVDAASGQTPCAVIEVFDAASCNCEAEPGRRTAPDALLTDEMRNGGNCHCEIMQSSGATQTICRTQTSPPPNNGNGWCYIDPAQQSDANCDLVSKCMADLERTIRYVNTNSEPRAGAAAYLRCEAQPITPLPRRCP